MPEVEGRGPGSESAYRYVTKYNGSRPRSNDRRSGLAGCACRGTGHRFRGVSLPSYHHLPRDACCLVGQRYSSQLWRLALEKLGKPMRRSSATSNMLDHGGSPDHHHAAQCLVAGARDNAKADLACGRMIFRRQADLGRELTARSEQLGLRGLHSQQCRPDRTDARDLDETLAAFISPMPSHKLGVDLVDLRL